MGTCLGSGSPYISEDEKKIKRAFLDSASSSILRVPVIATSKVSRGKANPQLVNEILKTKLK